MLPPTAIDLVYNCIWNCFFMLMNSFMNIHVHKYHVYIYMHYSSCVTYPNPAQKTQMQRMTFASAVLTKVPASATQDTPDFLWSQLVHCFPVSVCGNLVSLHHAASTVWNRVMFSLLHHSLPSPLAWGQVLPGELLCAARAGQRFAPSTDGSFIGWFTIGTWWLQHRAAWRPQNFTLSLNEF